MNTENSSVTRPWHSKLLGFTFYHRKGTKGTTVHRKSIAAYKEKIRAITCRSKPYPMEDRMMQIRRLNHGWGNYFKLSDAKSVFEELHSWVRSRIRLCYWKQWKKVKTRKRGIKSNQAYQWGNIRKGVLANGTQPYPCKSLKQCPFKRSRVRKSKRHHKPAENC